MDRLETQNDANQAVFCSRIYIPVWIDQKLSSMDRLETIKNIASLFIIFKFTFQYGQIRNFNFFYIIYLCEVNLHSSMDRLETERIKITKK